MSHLNLQVQQSWLYHKRILSYVVYSLNNSIMLEWSQDILHMLADWPSTETPRLFFDLSNPNTSMSYFVLTGRDLFNFASTPKARAELDELVEKPSDFRIKLAVLLSKTMVGVVTGSGRSTNILRQLVVGKVFFDRETALQWLNADDNYIPDSRTRAIDVKELLSETDMGLLSSETYRVGVNELRLLVNGSLEIVPISESHPVIIGRSARADLDLSTHGKPSLTVSRQHAQISLSSGELNIMDLGSTNGTYIGDKRLESGKPITIQHDEEIRIGALNIRILF
ncbi:MAG: FHA domain-containing protein [Anaerolineae bacterium]|nr:FHA domain-containing protein [Anaerolineae bacterium]